MTNKEFTNLLKSAEKLEFWNNGYLVTLGSAVRNGVDYFDSGAHTIFNQIKNEIYFRCYNDIPLTAEQQEILNR